MNANVHRQLNRRKRRIARRIENKSGVERPRPMMTASNIHYEIAEKARAIAPGGIGALHLLAQGLGLVYDIDEGLHLLKRHLPYHESDHVLNIAYNLLAGGSGLEHLEVRRNDEVYLDAFGAQRIPDPTTAGDFCRRFTEGDVEQLMDIFNETRLRAWKGQPDAFFDEAFIDADGTLAPSDGRLQTRGGYLVQGGVGLPPAGGLAGQHRRAACTWSTAAATGPRTSTPTPTSTRPPPCADGRGSAEDHVPGRHRFHPDQARLDRWDHDGVRFLFGIDAMVNLKGLGRAAPRPWRTAGWRGRTGTRSRRHPARPGSATGSRIVSERQFDTLKLIGEEVAEFPYRTGRLPEDESGNRTSQEAGGGEGSVVAARAGPIFLLHHQRSHDSGVRRSSSWPTIGAIRKT